VEHLASNQLFPLFMFLSVAAIALFSFVAVASWSDARCKEREAYYKNETLKKIAETMQGSGANPALELLREEDRREAQRRREGQRLGGLITTGVGIGVMIFLKALMTAEGEREPVYLVGLIPMFVGLALLAYSYLLAPKE
jgi:hypothetical protein